MSETVVRDESRSGKVRRAGPRRAVARDEDAKRTFGSYSADLIYGQPVIIAMRWVMVVSGLILILWNPDPLSIMRVQIVVIMLLALANFYLHSQLLMKRPVLDQVVYLASAVDLILITLLVAIGNGHESRLFTYYYPAILSFAVVFPATMTVTYVGSTVVVYGLIALISGGAPLVILARVAILAAVGFCGNLYLRIERNRRLEAQDSWERLQEQISQRQAELSS